ncbi:porin, partial [Natronospira sp.]
MNKHASSLIGIGLAALMSAPAANASSAESRLIEALVEEGTLSRERADALLAEDAPVKRFESFDYEPTMPVVGDDIRARVNKFAIETADGKHRFGFRGRLMADAAWLENPFKTTDDERADRGDIARYGTILRRARLGALGVMYDNWEWQLEVDFRDDEVRFANAYIAYLFPQGRLAVGHFKEPFSMESSTSS